MFDTVPLVTQNPLPYHALPYRAVPHHTVQTRPLGHRASHHLGTPLIGHSPGNDNVATNTFSDTVSNSHHAASRSTRS